MTSPPPATTLVALPEDLRSALQTLPALDALQLSGRSLIPLAPEPLHPLLQLLPGVAGLLATKGRGLGEVGECREAILLASSLGVARRCRRAGVPRVWGYGRGLARLWLRPAVPPPAPQARPRSEHFRELLSALEAPAPPSWVPRLELPRALIEAGAQRLERASMSPGDDDRPLFGLGLGSAGGKLGRWPWGRWVELARLLRRREPQARIVIFAPPEDLWSAVRIHEETGRIHPVLGPDLDSAGLSGAVSHLSRLFAADSDLLHLAAACGVPTVGLFGPTDPRVWAPQGASHRVVTAAGGSVEELVADEILAASR